MLQSTIKNRTIFCRDNLDILENINSNTIDLIYLDPPFNKKKVFTAPIGSSAEGASFKDYFREEDVKDEWLQTIKEDHIELYNFLNGIKNISSNKHYLYNYCYLAYMAIRLIEMYRILKDTGSLYFHCDPTMSHYIKLLMDIIFGEKNFRNEIVWKRTLGHHLSKGMDKATDHIFWYSKSNDFIYNQQYGDLAEKEIKKKFPYIEKETNRRYTHEKLEKTANEYSKGEKRIIQGKEIITDIGWIWTQKTFDERLKENPYCIVWTTNSRPRYKRYLDEYEGRKANNLWTDIKPIGSRAKERTGYPTQKPLALLQRIIRASSNKGDIVLDPFCGCATTCIAAEKLDRQWVGIDVSVKAYELVKTRLMKETDGRFDFNSPKGEGIQVHYTHSPPQRTDGNKDDDILKKYVYVVSNPAFENMYKVGIASNYQARLNSYQTSDPDRGYQLEHKKYTALFRPIEKHIHAKFKNKHEWVRGKLEDIIQEIENYEQ